MENWKNNNSREKLLKDCSLEELKSEFVFKGGNLNDLFEINNEEDKLIPRKQTKPIHYSWEGRITRIIPSDNSYIVLPNKGTKVREQYDMLWELYKNTRVNANIKDYWFQCWRFYRKSKATAKVIKNDKLGDSVTVDALINKYFRDLCKVDCALFCNISISSELQGAYFNKFGKYLYQSSTPWKIA